MNALDHNLHSLMQHGFVEMVWNSEIKEFEFFATEEGIAYMEGLENGDTD